MTFYDCITMAAQRALDWSDLPENLLPLVIVSEAEQLAPSDAEAPVGAAWH